MIYTLYYTFAEDFYNGTEVDVMDYEYYVEPNFQDILEYEYEMNFRKKYNVLNWYLEDGAKRFAKDIEIKWLKNQIDTSSLYTNYLFTDWLKEKYYMTALNKASLNNLDESTLLMKSCYDSLCYEYDSI